MFFLGFGLCCFDLSIFFFPFPLLLSSCIFSFLLSLFLFVPFLLSHLPSASAKTTNTTTGNNGRKPSKDNTVAAGVSKAANKKTTAEDSALKLVDYGDEEESDESSSGADTASTAKKAKTTGALPFWASVPGLFLFDAYFCMLVLSPFSFCLFVFFSDQNFRLNSCQPIETTGEAVGYS